MKFGKQFDDEVAAAGVLGTRVPWINYGCVSTQKFTHAFGVGYFLASCWGGGGRTASGGERQGWGRREQGRGQASGICFLDPLAVALLSLPHIF
jgi:hypothetical protein